MMSLRLLASFLSLLSWGMSHAQVYMYGTTSSNGAYGLGTIYRVDQNGEHFEKVFDFTTETGGKPSAGLTLENGKLYGFTNTEGQMVNEGASIALGSFYEFDPLTNSLHVIAHIDDLSEIGNTFDFAPILGSDGLLYAASRHTSLDSGSGSLWSYHIASNTFRILEDDLQPYGSIQSPLLSASDGNIYWTSYEGGYGWGSICRYVSQGDSIQVLHESAGPGPVSQEYNKARNNKLIESSTGKLYGCSNRGGAKGFGCLFRIDLDGSDYESLFHFDAFMDHQGYYPEGGFIEKDGILYSTTSEYRESGKNKGAFYQVQLSTNELGLIYPLDFEGTRPLGTFVESPNGRFYITCSGGGENNGSIIEFKPPYGPISQTYAFIAHGGTVPLHDQLCVVDISNTDSHGLDADISLFELYPNPASDFIEIKKKTNYSIHEINIYDLHGKLMTDNIMFEDSKFDIREFNPGMYIIAVEFENGVRQSRKVLIKHQYQKD